MTNVPNLISAYVDESRRFDPVAASRAGLVAFDDALGDPGQDRARDSLATRERLATELGAIDPAPLTADERLDRAFALALIAFDRVWFAQRPWATRPDHAFGHAIQGIYHLALRPNIDGVDRRPAILARLAAIPDYLNAAAREITTDASRHTCNLAIHGIQAGRLFLERVASESIRSTSARSSEITHDLDRVMQAIDTYEAKVATVIESCDGDYALGQEKYDELLNFYQMSSYNHDTLWRMGQEMIEQFRQDLAYVAGQIDRSRSVGEIVRSLKNDYPEADQVIPDYRAEITRSRSFVVDKDLVSIPPVPDEQFEVAETPLFMRSTIPFGFVSMAPVFSSSGRSVWHITLPQLDDDEVTRAQTLQGHNRWNTWAITFHEGYPGHHLNALHLKSVSSDLRRQFGVSVFTEGWGLYTEELMEEQGYFTDPRAKFMQVLNSLWRAVRVVVDTGLHTRGMSIPDAAKMLTDVSYLEPKNALVEASRYAITPTYAASYLMGKMMIVDLREKYFQRFPEDQLRTFHDRLLSFGAIPPAIIEGELI